jgi:hypothetical protein
VFAADVDDHPVDPAVEPERWVVVGGHRGAGVGADQAGVDSSAVRAITPGKAVPG